MPVIDDQCAGVRELRAPRGEEKIAGREKASRNPASLLLAEVGKANRIVHIWSHEECVESLRRRWRGEPNCRTAENR